MIRNRIGNSSRFPITAGIGAFGLLAVALTGGCQPTSGPDALTGDWDYYRMLGAEPSGGFEAKRRFGFVHFEGLDLAGAWFHRRAGGDLEIIRGLALEGDSLFMDFASGNAVRAGVAIQRMWLVRRDAAPVYEPYYPLWPGPVSDSTFAVEIDPAVPMQARDGTTLMSFVARPITSAVASGTD